MRSRWFYVVAGASFGALVSWAVTADIYENRFKKDLEKQEEEINNKIDEKIEEIWAFEYRKNLQLVKDNPKEFLESNDYVNTDNVINSEVEPEIEEEPIKTVDESKEVLEEAQEDVSEIKSNVQNLIEQYSADPEAQAEFDRITQKVEIDGHYPPSVISREQYAFDEEGQYYSKITLTYYPRDRVLLDDQDEPMDDVAAIVGWRNLSRFGDQSEDPEVVFIRNHRLETDFEVIKEEEQPLPLHVKYGMEKEEFRVNKAAGLIKLRQEDE